MIQKLICQVLIFNFVFMFPFMPNAEAKPGAKNAALVKIVKGKAFKVINGKQSPIKKKEWLKEGTTVKTEAKSFVRLVYTDKSTMNVGPKSEMKIEQFDNKEPGMINVIKGKIRSKVSKDYLKIDKKRSKLLVRTPSAVMGVRGTEFVVSSNLITKGVNKGTYVSSVAVVEGNVMVANLDKKMARRKKFNPRMADKMINKKGLPTTAGKACVVQRNPKAKKPQAMKVVTMSAAQVDSIAKNSVTEKASVTDESSTGQAGKKKKMKKVALPPGISQEIADKKDDSAGGVSSLEKSVGKTAGVATEQVKDAVEKKMQSAPVNEIKAADGTIHVAAPVTLLDLDTGVTLPPSETATINEMGMVVHDDAVSFSDTGSAQIAGDIKIDHSSGAIVKEVVNQSGQVTTVEIGDANADPAKMKEVMKQVEQGVAEMTVEAGAPPPVEGPAPASINGEPGPNGEMGPDGPGPGGPEGAEVGPDGTQAGVEAPPVNDFLDATFTNGAGAGQVLLDNSSQNFIDNQIQQNNAPPASTATPGSTNVSITVE
ncbi:FecR family protein [Bacteriovoracaceae bacterium]|nr:FecR family protein [Bacteriovoracaceae bacterium]